VDGHAIDRHGPPGGAEAAARHGPADRIPPEAIGIQLYTVRTALAADPEGTLAALAAIGYRRVETAGTHGRTAADFRAALDRHGLRAASGHVRADGDWSRAVEEACALGHRFMVVPWASHDTADAWRRLADELNTAGELAAASGLRLGYHNHAHEFRPLPTGETPWDILLARTDPRLVHFELDLYWAVAGGRDPAALIRAHPGRIPQYHVKDRAADGSFADPGAGTIDFPRIFAHSPAAGAVEYIVEHDRPDAPLRAARAGYAYLRALRIPRR